MALSAASAPAFAQFGPRCGTGSARDSFSFGAAGTIEPSDAQSALYPDSECVQLGRQYAASAIADGGSSCQSQYREARSHGLRADGNHGAASPCANIGYEAGAALLHYYARTDHASDIPESGPDCIRYYAKGKADYGKGSTAGDMGSNNVTMQCYQSGHWDASEAALHTGSAGNGSTSLTDAVTIERSTDGSGGRTDSGSSTRVGVEVGI